MKRFFWLWVMLLVTFPVASQPAAPDAGTLAPADFESERARIEAARTREELHFEQEDVACYERFAVNDCLGRSRVLRRQVFDQLRRQEVVLNDAERKQKAQEQLKRIREKSSSPP